MKIDIGKKDEINLKKLYNDFSNDIRKSCDQNIPIIIFDNDSQKHSFVKFMYHFYDYQFIQFYINKNDQKILSSIK